jgi:flagellar motor switch protein FliM
MDVDIELEVELGKIHSTVGEIASLRVGDELRIVTGEVLAITVDGVSIVYGMPGQLGENVAVRVTAPSDK